MLRVLALSFMLATLAVSVAFAGDAINTATLTCLQLETSSHNDMVAMDKAMYAALKSDPKFGSLSLDQFANAEDRACKKHPHDKVIDALKAEDSN